MALLKLILFITVICSWKLNEKSVAAVVFLNEWAVELKNFTGNSTVFHKFASRHGLRCVGEIIDGIFLLENSNILYPRE